MSSDFRKLTDVVLRAAKERQIETLDWGDAVSLEFTDGCDALHLVSSDVDGSDAVEGRAERVFQRYTELNGRRMRVLFGLLWICHSKGARFGMRRSGCCRVEKGEVSTTVQVGNTLTCVLAEHSNVRALQGLCESLGWRFSMQEYASWLEREDPPPMPATFKEVREPPLDDETWAAQVEGMFPSLEQVFLPAEQLPEITEEMVAQAEEHARRCWEEGTEKPSDPVKTRASLLGSDLPMRRSLSFDLKELVAEIIAADEPRVRMQFIEEICTILRDVGAPWMRRLLSADDLEVVRTLVAEMVADLPTHTLWVHLDEVAAMLGSLGWEDLADQLLERPDLPSLLFSLPWQSLQQGGKRRSLSSGHTSFQEPLLSLSLVRPEDPRVVRWVAFGLELQERLGVKVEQRLPLAHAWRRCAEAGS